MKKGMLVVWIVSTMLLMGACIPVNEQVIVGKFEDAKVLSKKVGGRGTSPQIQLDIAGNVVNLKVSDGVYTLVEEGTKIDGTYDDEMYAVDVWISGTEKVEKKKKEE